MFVEDDPSLYYRSFQPIRTTLIGTPGCLQTEVSGINYTIVTLHRSVLENI